jgi:hypothetical protein
MAVQDLRSEMIDSDMMKNAAARLDDRTTRWSMCSDRWPSSAARAAGLEGRARHRDLQEPFGDFGI